MAKIDLRQTFTSLGKSKKRKADESDADSEIEILETTFSEGKRRRGEDVIPSTSNNATPSEATFAAWSRGDDDMEASVKMSRMLEYLKEWDTVGDKTIIYSQCRLFEILISFTVNHSLMKGLQCLISSRDSFHVMASGAFDLTVRWIGLPET